MFRANVLIIRRSKLHYTASGIITPIGSRLVHRLREAIGGRLVHRLREAIGGRLVHRLRDNISQPVRETATYRCDDTRVCLKQF